MNQPQQHSASPAAGWYPDPSQAGMTRYWDGQQWSERVAPAAVPQPVPAGTGASIYPPGAVLPPAKSDADKFALWGYITAVVFPIVGLYLGFKLRSMGDKRGNTVLIVAAVIIVLGLLSLLVDSSSAATLGSG